MAQFILMKLHQRATRDTRWFALLDTILPQLLKPPEFQSIDSRPLVPANDVLGSLITFLGLLLTFGVMFPPLGVSLCGTIIVWVFFVRFTMGRFLLESDPSEQPRLLELMERSCIGTGNVTVLRNTKWYLVIISCAFYSLFLFDVLGDKVSFAEAFWVLIVVPLLPLTIFGLDQLLEQWSLTTTTTASPEMGGTEMVESRGDKFDKFDSEGGLETAVNNIYVENPIAGSSVVDKIK
jgi:hypothetical protein